MSSRYFNTPIEDYDIKSMNDGKIIAVIEHSEKIQSTSSTRKKVTHKNRQSDFEIKILLFL